ncbi:hypothetical protein Bhyg_12385 [Pseudolycoriella hygida]|uniref:Uncharacterized protein n=1 Tax=Pseudolycoriella hygida TaxID=35572 RepID=A0A9Q0MX87_9DIPT|nr:hypothetical protein Bhyg_12385 [Pseudolycoriella hygida]
MQLFDQPTKTIVRKIYERALSTRELISHVELPSRGCSMHELQHPVNMGPTVVLDEFHLRLESRKHREVVAKL